MKRIFTTVAGGFALAGGCVGLIALPNPFNPHDDGFNGRLPLVCFSGLAMAGLAISLVLGLWGRRRLPRFTLPLTWCSSALLAVVLPAPAILGGAWADGLIPGYVGAAGLVGGLWGWSLNGQEKPPPPQ